MIYWIIKEENIMDRKRSLKRILAGVMALSMVSGMMPINEVDFNVDKNTWVHAKEYSDSYVEISDLQVGDIIRDSVNELVCYDDQYALTLKAGGYIDSFGFGEVSDRDVTLSKEHYYDINSRYGRYLPYCNGGTAEGWQVVSVDHEAKTLTLTGYSAPEADPKPLSGENIKYYEYDADSKALVPADIEASSCYQVSNGDRVWENGSIYVLTEDTTFEKRIVIKGSVKLILKDGVTLTAKQGIQVNEGAQFAVYAQSIGEKAGKLFAGTTDGIDTTIARDPENAAIGGNSCFVNGTISIHGGIINARSNAGPAAIGGGQDSVLGTLNIYGGDVTASVADANYSASIGGGYYKVGGTVNIYGGKLTAKNQNQDSRPTTWNVADGAVIKAGNNSESAEVVDVVGNQYYLCIDAGNVVLEQTKTTYLSASFNEENSEVEFKEETIKGASDLSGTDIEWNDKTFVVTENTVISDQIVVTGNVKLILSDDKELTAAKGIKVSEDASLSIYGQTKGTGKLIAIGSNGNTNENGLAGINGKVIIHGGTISSTGGIGGTGYGKSSWAQGNVGNTGGSGIAGDVTIYAGTFNLTGGKGGTGGLAQNNGGNGGTGGSGLKGNIKIYGGSFNLIGGVGGDPGNARNPGKTGNTGAFISNSASESTIIYGGDYNFEPDASYLAENYNCTQNGERWKVQLESPEYISVNFDTPEGLIYSGKKQKLLTVTGDLDADIKAWYAVRRSGEIPPAIENKKNRDAYSRIQAEKYDAYNGSTGDKTYGHYAPGNYPNSRWSDDGVLGWITKGDAAVYKDVVFGEDEKEQNIIFRYSSGAASQVSIWIDGKNKESGGTKLKTLTLKNTANWEVPNTVNETLDVNVNGKHDVYLVFDAAGLNVDYFAFSGAEWKEELPSAVDAGMYEIKCKLVDADNKVKYSGSFENTIAKKDLSIVKASAEKVYDGKAFDAKNFEYYVSDETKCDASEIASLLDDPKTEVKLAFTKSDDDSVTGDGKTAGSYNVNISITNPNYEAVALEKMKAVISKADLKVESPSKRTATYGQKLSEIALPEAENGKWTWVEPAETTVGNAGTNSFKAIFAPADANYNTVQKDVSVEVAKANVTITEAPSAADIVYEQSLADSKLTGGTVMFGETPVKGTFAWKDRTVKPSVADGGKTKYTVVFTPEDNKNFNTAECKITLAVAKATPDYTEPKDLATTYGKTLEDVILPKAENGKWSWDAAAETNVGTAG